MRLTLGSDPEYYVSQGGEIVSAIPFFGQHGKDNPLSLSDQVRAYYDNVSCEATIRPADSEDGFIKSFAEMYGLVSNYLGDMGCCLVAKAAHTFNPKYLNCDEANTFGCRAEFSAYTNDDGSWMIYDPPNPEVIGNLRVCGGHIHIGRSDFQTAPPEAMLLSFQSQIELARMLDSTLATALTYLDKDESNVERKKLYGRPGSIRNTPYGIEYRTLSNYWTTRPELIAFVFNIVEKTIRYYESNPEYVFTLPFKEIRECILTSNKDTALSLFMKSPLNSLSRELFALNSLPYTPHPVW